MSAPTVKFELDGKTIEVPVGSTIYDAARLHGVDIPVLCHKEDSQDEFKSVGVCRVCCVMEGSPRLPDQVPKRFIAACCRKVEEGMTILTEPEPVRTARETLLELLLSEHPVPCPKHSAFHSCELELLGEKYGLLRTELNPEVPDATPGRYVTRWAKPPVYSPRAFDKGADTSNPSINVDHGSCILCDRCVRACNDVAGHHVIGREGKGVQSAITFDDGQAMGRSACVNCGWCMVACPTGALTYGFGTQPESPAEPKRDGKRQGGALTAAEMKSHDLWRDVSIEFLRRAEGGVVERHYAAGEIICRQGEFGSTAFYVESGEVEIYLEDSQGHVRTKTSKGLVKRVTSLLFNKHSDARKGGEDRRPFIPIDAGVDLDARKPLATLGAGELFGEASCINSQPRSATIRATKPTVVLEMLRNVLDILRRQKRFRERSDERYRRFALDNHLRTSELFRDLPADVVEHLRSRVSLLAYEPGDVIFRQGDEADALYLVRLGHVKVVETYGDGGSVTLAYLSRGEVFGEIGLIGSAGNARTATCAALDHVEVVRVDREDFEFLRKSHPPLDGRVREIGQGRLRANRERAGRQRSVSLQQYVDQGLYEAQSLLVLDLERCTRCDECVRACAEAHNGVSRLLREGLRFDKYLVTTSCRSCRDPLCMIGCPVGAIHRRENKEILIADHCVGCGLCAEQCPYGNIAMHPFGVKDEQALALGKGPGFKATVCDLCTDQCLDEDEAPSCVYACPHDAASRVSGTELFDRILGPSQAAKLKAMVPKE